MSRRTIVGDEDAPEINLSSMIDCIFILLIFFIVTTVFVEEQGLAVNKPDSAATSVSEKEENLVLEIDQQNKVLVDGAEVSLADVPARVKATMSEPDIPVVIRAHEKSTHGMFVSVWDAAKKGGAQTLSFSTVN